MAQSFDQQRGRSPSASSSSASSTKAKSNSILQSRSNSRLRHLEATDDIRRTVSFSSNEKDGDFSNARKPSEVETLHGPIQRSDMPEALSSRSLQSWNGKGKKPKVKKQWPKDWRAYVCLFGGFLLMFNSWGLVNTYGTYASFYMQELLPSLDLELLNLVGSTQSGIVLFFSAMVGRFLDAGYIRPLLITGTILLSIGSFTLSVANGDAGRGDGNYGLIWLTQGFVSGLGMACFFVSSSQVVATWFIDRKSFAIGIVASGASISGLIYPTMTRFLIEDYQFNIATRWVATVITLTCVLAIICARPRKEHIIRPLKSFDIKEFWDNGAFREPAYAFLVAAIAFLFFGYYAIFFNLEEWATSEGFGLRKSTTVGANAGLPAAAPQGSIQTFWLLAILNATSTVGRIGSAYLSDHFGALNVHAVVTLIGSLLVLILWTLSHTLPSALAFVIIFGAFSGAVIGLPPASVAYILGKDDPTRQAKLGQWTGMMYTCASVFALTGPVIAGHLISKYKTYVTVQAWSGASMFITSLCMGCAVYFRRRDEMNRLKRKFSSTTMIVGTPEEKV